MTRHTAMIYGGIAVCVVCIFLFPYGKRLYDQFPRYEWEPNHQGNVKNKEDFGAKYLDEYLHETWLGKIYVETEEDALRKFRNKRANYLFFNNYDKDSLEIANIISNANKGNRYIFVGTNTDLIENLDINATAGNKYFDIKEFHYGNHERKTLIIKNGKGKSTTSIRLWGEMAYDNFMSSALDQDSIIVHTPFYHCYGNLPKGTYTPLISLTSGYDIAARRNIGNGCITIVYSFAFFTNYAASDDDMRKGMERCEAVCVSRSAVGKPRNSRPPLVAGTPCYSFCSEGSSILITFAGTPPTTAKSGTSFVTTAPAATTAYSPIVTPGQTVTFIPSQAFFLIVTLP